MSSLFDDPLYPIHRMLAKAAARHLSTLSGNILDIGCGTSPYRRFLPKDVYYIGVDVFIRAASVRGAAEALPFRSASFDGVLCTEVLEISERPWKAIEEIYRVLKPGGRLYITFPFDWHVMSYPDHFRVTPYGLRSLVERVGLVVEEQESIGGLFSVTSSKIVEGVVYDLWVPLTKRLGVKRGAYRLAALAAAPWNLTTLAFAPVLDKLNRRSPLSTAILALKP